MAIRREDQRAFESLELRIQTILPEEYQDRAEEVRPVSMGSAALKYGPDGKVAWNEIWRTFCDLAMAGGPPHKGRLLEPGSPEEIEAQPAKYREVTAEICRGVNLAAGVAVSQSQIPGWVQIDCGSAGMAGWLGRAIVMENVSARCDGRVLYLPSGPGYRIEKEIKNVVTVIAKTCHYWVDHMWSAQQRVIAELFTNMDRESPLIQPAVSGFEFQAESDALLRGTMSEAIRDATGLAVADVAYAGWLGVECSTVRTAVWLMRAMVGYNVLSRREETVLFVPVNPVSDPSAEAVVQALARVCGFARAKGILPGCTSVAGV
ncbi:MAG: hypothetical protein JWN34_1691 [Bryobacterales bacterium]|nr:hypothetical protein [Bryobacterales bacterium]